MVLLVRYLPHQHEDLSGDSHSRVQVRCGGTCVTSVLVDQRLDLVGLPASKISDLQAQRRYPVSK